MPRIAKLMILLLMLAALPLRGYATAVKDLCDAHHGGPAQQQVLHEHSGEHGHDGHNDDTSQSGTASLCSLCSVCSVGAPAVSDSLRPVAFGAAAALRIPFLLRFGAEPSLERLDRPPLAL